MRLAVFINAAAPPDSVWRWPDYASAQLREHFPGLEIAEYHHRPEPNRALPADAIEATATAAAAIAWRFDPRLLATAKQLRWIHCPAAAVDLLLTPELNASDIVVTNGAAVHGPTVAEHTLALMLGLSRGLGIATRHQVERRWDQIGFRAASGGLGDLRGATALIAGLGHIGAEVAPRLQALGMTVIGLRQHAERPAAGCAEVHPTAALDALLPRADYVVLAVPVTTATRALMGADQFARMKPSARLINVGRGALVEEPALIEALRTRRIAGAALDVFAVEPLPADSPLWSLPTLLMTPHSGAMSDASWARQLRLITENLERFRAGQPLAGVVNKQLGY